MLLTKSHVLLNTTIFFWITLISDRKAKVHLEDSVKIKMYSFFFIHFSGISEFYPWTQFRTPELNEILWDHNHGFLDLSTFFKMACIVCNPDQPSFIQQIFTKYQPSVRRGMHQGYIN